MKKALITGGAGFIGSYLSELLLANGWQVSVIDNLSTGSKNNLKNCFASKNFSLIIDDILNEKIMDKLISKSDVIFHLAAAVGVKLVIENPLNAIRTNIFGTETILKIATRYKKRVLITSTSEVYGKSRKLPFKENNELLIGPTTKSRWSYACSKALEEFSALAYYKKLGLPVIIVRLFNTIGPRQTGKYGMVVPTFITQAIKNKPITVFGSGRQTRCFIDVDEIVNAFILLVEHQQTFGKIINLGSNKEISINKLAKLVINLTKSRSKIIHIPYQKAYGSSFEDMLRRIPNISKAKRLIGFSPKIKLEDSIKRIITEKKKALRI